MSRTFQIDMSSSPSMILACMYSVNETIMTNYMPASAFSLIAALISVVSVSSNSHPMLCDFSTRFTSAIHPATLLVSGLSVSWS